MSLTKDEKELLASVEAGEWRSVANVKEALERYQALAHASQRKDKRVNIRMAERDLIRLQKIAMREGLPYQTLISSILHKFINGRLVETTGVSAEQ